MNPSTLSAGESSPQADRTGNAPAPGDAPGSMFSTAADIMRQWAEVQKTLPQSNPEAVAAVLVKADHMDVRAAGAPYDPTE